jgi:NUMOD3 motif
MIKGSKMTEESRRKLRESHLGQIPWIKGRHHSQETKEKLRELSKGNKSHLGHKHTEATKKRIGELSTGRKVSGVTRMKLSLVHKGKKLSKEHVEKIRIAKQNQSEETRRKIGDAHRGPKSSNWKGGITPINKLIRRSSKYLRWVDEVFNRDDYVCQKTGIRGGRLEAHHIKSFSENQSLRLDINNGITLSVNSHREFHKKYGRKNIGREQIEEFIGRKLTNNI